MKSLNQLLLDFDYEQNFKDDDFYVGKSNFYAFEMINKWPKWEKNFLYIICEKFSPLMFKKFFSHLGHLLIISKA
jgi:chromosomal replication initiation ATPase DnaA